MNLGLDLRGGIYVLIDVDMDAAVDQALERYVEDIRTQLRDDKVRYLTVASEGGHSSSSSPTPRPGTGREGLLAEEFRDLQLTAEGEGDDGSLIMLP